MIIHAYYYYTLKKTWNMTVCFHLLRGQISKKKPTIRSSCGKHTPNLSPCLEFVFVFISILDHGNKLSDVFNAKDFCFHFLFDWFFFLSSSISLVHWPFMMLYVYFFVHSIRLASSKNGIHLQHIENYNLTEYYIQTEKTISTKRQYFSRLEPFISVECLRARVCMWIMRAWVSESYFIFSHFPYAQSI